MRYANEPGAESHTATVIMTYRRSDDLKPTTAPTVRNEAIALLNTSEAIHTVALMHGNRLFFLARDPLGWHDVTGREVEIVEVSE